MEENSKYINLIKAIIASGVSLFVVYAVNLILTPYIIKNVGTEAYGFLALAKQFTQYAAIFTAAVNSFVVRYISVEYNKKSYESANKFFSSSYFGNIFLAIAILVILSVGLLVFEKLAIIPELYKRDVQVTFFLVFINFIISNVFIPYSSAAYIAHKLQVVSIFGAVGIIVEACAVFIMFERLQNHIYYIALAMIFNTIIISITDYVICRRCTPYLRVDYSNYDFSTIKRLIAGGIWTSVNSLGEVLNHGLDLLVCDILLTPIQMGQLAVAKTVQAMFLKGYALFDKPFQPIFLKYYSSGDKKQLLVEFRLAMKLSSMVTNIGFAGIWALGIPFFTLWLPGQDTKLLYNLSVITILTIIPGGSMHPLYYIYTLTVKQKVPSMITIIGGFMNVIGMVVAIKYTNLGVYAVAWTTVIVMYVINFISNPLYMAHVLGYKWYVFYPSIIKNIISEIILMMLFYVIAGYMNPNSYLDIAVCVMICMAVGVVVHYNVVFSKEEKSRVIVLIKKKMGHTND